MGTDHGATVTKVLSRRLDANEMDDYSSHLIAIELAPIDSAYFVERGSFNSSEDGLLTPPLDNHDETLERTYPDGGFKANLVTFGSFLGLTAVMGITNSMGAIQVYVSTHQLADVQGSLISWIFSVYLALAYIVSIFAGAIFDNHGVKALLLGALGLMFSGLMGAANSTTVWQFVLSFVALGIGSGLGMTPLIGVVSHWFKRKRANYTGIAMSGGSVGGLAFPLMLRYCYVKYSFEWALRILAFTCAGLIIALVILVRDRRTNKKPARELGKEDFKAVFASLRPTNLRDKTYWLIVMGGFFTELSLVLLLTYLATYATSRGMSEDESYLLLTVWNGCSIAGRMLPGYVADKIGYFNVNIIMLLLFTISTFALWLPFGGNPRVLYAYSSLGGFALGSIFSLLPVCLSHITPVNELGSKFGFLCGVTSVTFLFGVPIGSVVIGSGSVHEYNMFAVFVGCLAVCGTFFWSWSRYRLVGARLNIKI